MPLADQKLCWRFNPAARAELECADAADAAALEQFRCALSEPFPSGQLPEQSSPSGCLPQPARRPVGALRLGLPCSLAGGS